MSLTAQGSVDPLAMQPMSHPRANSHPRTALRDGADRHSLGESLRTLALAALILLTPVPQAWANQEVLIGGGSVSGLYFQVARQLCDMLNRHSGGKYRCSGRAALGSVFNINAIAGGLLEFGLAQSDRSWQAVSGRAEWNGAPQDRLRSVFALHPESVMLVTRAAAGIGSVDDLRGRRVNIGNPGSGQRGNAEDVLRLHGLDLARDLQSSEMQQHEASRALQRGEIDAFFYTAGNPSEAISEPAATTALALVPLDSERMLRFVSGKTYYMVTEIPARTYSGVDTAVRTYGVRAQLMTSVDTPEELVYDLARTVFANLDELRATHPALEELDPNIMLSTLSAPLHPGAERYYRERRWILPDTVDAR